MAISALELLVSKKPPERESSSVRSLFENAVVRTPLMTCSVDRFFRVETREAWLSVARAEWAWW
jgi:hypothetical protein